MENTNDFTLIDSTFSPSEAREILSHMIESKINFHAIRNLSSQERYGHADEHSIERMRHLRTSWDSLQEMMDYAKKEGLELKIHAGLHVELVEQEEQRPALAFSHRYN